MSNENVTFHRGKFKDLPVIKTAGALLVATDTGDVFLDDSNTSRIQLKDSTKLPKDGGKIGSGSNYMDVSLRGISVVSPQEKLDVSSSSVVAEKGSAKTELKADGVSTTKGGVVSNVSDSISITKSSEAKQAQISHDKIVLSDNSNSFEITATGVQGNANALANWKTWLTLPDSYFTKSAADELYLSKNGGTVGTEAQNAQIHPTKITVNKNSGASTEVSADDIKLKDSSGRELSISASGVAGNDTALANWKSWLQLPNSYFTAEDANRSYVPKTGGKIVNNDQHKYTNVTPTEVSVVDNYTSKSTNVSSGKVDIQSGESNSTELSDLHLKFKDGEDEFEITVHSVSGNTKINKSFRDWLNIYTKNESDSRYVRANGDEISGTTEYVSDDGKISIHGDTLTFYQKVDDEFIEMWSAKSDGTLDISGNFVLDNLQNSLNIVTKIFTEANPGLVPMCAGSVSNLVLSGSGKWKLPIDFIEATWQDPKLSLNIHTDVNRTGEQFLVKIPSNYTVPSSEISLWVNNKSVNSSIPKNLIPGRVYQFAIDSDNKWSIVSQFNIECDNGIVIDEAGKISHSTAENYKHIPTGGSHGNILGVTVVNSLASPRWCTPADLGLATQVDLRDKMTIPNADGSTGDILKYVSKGKGSWVSINDMEIMTAPKGDGSAKKILTYSSRKQGEWSSIADLGIASQDSLNALSNNISGKMDSPSGTGSSGMLLSYSSANKGQWKSLSDLGIASADALSTLSNAVSSMSNNVSGKMDSPSGTGANGKLLAYLSNNKGQWLALSDLGIATASSVTSLTNTVNSKMTTPSNTGASGHLLAWVSATQGKWQSLADLGIASASALNTLSNTVSTLSNTVNSKMDSPSGTGSSGKLLAYNSSNKGEWKSLSDLGIATASSINNLTTAVNQRMIKPTNNGAANNILAWSSATQGQWKSLAELGLDDNESGTFRFQSTSISGKYVKRGDLISISIDSIGSVDDGSKYISNGSYYGLPFTAHELSLGWLYASNDSLSGNWDCAFQLVWVVSNQLVAAGPTFVKYDIGDFKLEWSKQFINYGRGVLTYIAS